MESCKELKKMVAVTPTDFRQALKIDLSESQEEQDEHKQVVEHMEA
jgi:hypothetical protein